MQEVSGFPFFEVQFTKDGKIFNDQEVSALVDYLKTQPVTDLLIMSHGWNNDVNDARATYNAFFARMREVLDGGHWPTRKFAVMGVLWPSKKFADKEVIPSGAAGAGSPITDTLLKQQLDDLKAVLDSPDAAAQLEKAKKLVSKLEDKQTARRQFADILRAVVPQNATNNEDASDVLFKLPGDEVINRLSKPVMPTVVSPALKTGTATSVGAGPSASSAGGAAGLGQFFSGIKSGAYNLLNYLTYYLMKERAGITGQTGVNQALQTIRAARPDLKIHMMGHSFGGRLVTAAVAGPANSPVVKVESMTLIQAAFSHYGFAQHYDGINDGFFRKIVTNQAVKGPIVITYTVNDKAVGIAYPLASLVAGQVASGLGDKNDIYGGLGRNGAQKTPEAVDGTLLPMGNSYQFQGGKFYNLNADAVIKDHGDISHNEIAQAIFTAVYST